MATAVTKEDIALGLFDIGGISFGEFTYKSGIKAPMYVDLRIFVSYPNFLKKVAKAYAAMIKPLKYDRLAGIAYGALPIAGAVSLEMGEPWVYARKEGLAKAYGLKKVIEGNYEKGETVLVIDDLTTTGGAKLDIVGTFNSAGLKIKDFVVLLDYEKGAGQTLAKKGYKLHSFMTIRELLEILRQKERLSDEQYKKCIDFLNS